MASIMSESERLEKAIRAVLRKIIAEETNDCLRVIKATVSTAPNANTGLCGVKFIGDDTELLVPYTTVTANVAVGDAVLVATIYDSMRNAVVWQTSPMT